MEVDGEEIAAHFTQQARRNLREAGASSAGCREDIFAWERFALYPYLSYLRYRLCLSCSRLSRSFAQRQADDRSRTAACLAI